MKLSTIYEEVLNEISVEDAYQKFYNKIPKGVYDQIIVADPFSKPAVLSPYAKWLLKLTLNGKLKIEDLYKATDYITVFNKVKGKLAVESRDINKFNSLVDMLTVIKPFLEGEKEMRSGKEIEKAVKDNEAKKLHDGEKWLVVQPLTEKAACYYGKNTEWCTAAETSNNAFEYYHNMGPLFINIDKVNNRKYQFHFEESQFMDENDSEIDLMWLLGKNPELNEFYEQYLADKVKDLTFKDFEITEDGCFIIAKNWGNFSVAFKESRDYMNPAEYLHNSTENFYDDFPEYSRSDIEIYYLGDINEANRNAMLSILAKGGVNIDEIEDDDELDEMILDEFEDEISRALSEAKRSANESEMYNSITKEIKDHYNIGDTQYDSNDKLRLKLNRCPSNVILYMSAGNYFIDNFAELYDGENKIDYSYPDYGYDGNISEEYFNERLSDALGERVTESTMKSKIQSLIKEYFELKETSTPPKIQPGTPISDELRYHIDNGIPLNECVFRYGSDQYNAVIQEVKELLSVNLIELNETDKFIAEDHEVESALFEGYEVVCGIIQEDIEEEGLNESDKFKGKKSGTPTRDSSGGKAYKVHVAGCSAKTETNPRGIKVIRFGSGGLKAKINGPDARKRYDSRHGCSAGKHNDKCMAGYYSCRLPRYASALGLSGGGKWW